MAGTNLAGDTREAFVRDVKGSPREAPPGEAYRYTHAGFSLLAAIIESASGQRYEAYLRQYAFEPAGMKTALFRDEVPANDSLFARGYVGTPAALERGPQSIRMGNARRAGVGDRQRHVPVEFSVSGEYLYAVTNSSGVPTNVMFLSERHRAICGVRSPDAASHAIGVQPGRRAISGGDAC